MLSVADPDFPLLPGSTDRLLGQAPSELYDETGKKMYTVLIPTSPNPTTGFLQIVGEDEITRTNISVENAVKMIVSAGKASPKNI